MQLLPYQYASHPRGSIRVDGREVVGATEDDMLQVRGERVGMVFQEPMTSLNPLHTIERQIGEVLYVHRALGKRDARERTFELWIWSPCPTRTSVCGPIRTNSPAGSGSG